MQIGASGILRSTNRGNELVAPPSPPEPEVMLQAPADLIQNAALLVSMTLVYGVIERGGRWSKPVRRIAGGLAVASITVGVMLVPWEFVPGIQFDTRSIVLSVSGLFFGFVPTAIASVAAGALRALRGGAGMWTGIAVILASAGIGLVWRAAFSRERRAWKWYELYPFGVAVHVVMMLCMISLPSPYAADVIRSLTLPVLLVYPPVTVLLGKLLALRRESLDASQAAERAERRFRKMLTHSGDVTLLVDESAVVRFATESAGRILGCAPDSLRELRLRDLMHPEDAAVVEKVLARPEATAADSSRCEARFSHADGSWRWMDVAITNLLSDSDVHAVVLNCRDVTDRRTAELALRRERDLLHSIAGASPIAIAVLDRDGSIVFANEQAERTLRLSKREITQRAYDTPRWVITDFEGKPYPSAALPFRRVLTERRAVFDVRHAITTADGERVLLSINAAPVFADDGAITSVVAVASDVTEWVESQEQVKRLGRTYRMLSNVNELIVHNRDLRVLYREVCRTAVEDGGFRMAWIGLIDEESGDMCPVAADGARMRQVNALRVHRDHPVARERLVSQAVRDGERVVCNDLEHDPRLEACRDAALRLGYRACGAFPLRVFGTVRGVLNLYAGVVGAFDDEETALIAELAMDVSYAMEFSEEAERRGRAEAALAESEARYRSLFENSHAPMLLIDPVSGELRDVNKAAVAYYGWLREVMLSMSINEINTLGPDEVSQDMSLATVEERKRFAFRHRRADGSVRDVEVYSGPIRVGDATLLYSIVHDVTQRRVAEQRIDQELLRRDALLREVQHRVKNNLNIVASLLNLQAQRARTTEEALEGLRSSRNRVFAMGSVYDALPTSGTLTHIHMGPYLQSVVTQVATLRRSHRDYDVRLEADTVTLDIDRAVPCGLLVNELLSIAIQSRAAERFTRDSALTVELRPLGDDSFELAVRDEAVAPEETAWGTGADSLVEQLVSALVEQLKGTLTVTRNGGTGWTVRFPG
jgi:PAS domain S-box-containing protein